MRMRKKPNLPARMERCSPLLLQDPAKYRGSWKGLMPDARQVWLELGCGKGQFTAQMAQANPDILYIAIERAPDAMIIAMERCLAAGLHNVYFIDGDVSKLGEYFGPDEISLIYINFCDPWPSNRHAKRRLTHPDFLLSYRSVLQEKGQIQFKTDNHDLFEWSLFQFPKVGYALEQVTRNLHEDGICGFMTDYEEKFHQQGMNINRCVAVKGALPETPGDRI